MAPHEEGKGAEKNSRRKRLLSDKWIFFVDLLGNSHDTQSGIVSTVSNTVVAVTT